MVHRTKPRNPEGKQGPLRLRDGVIPDSVVMGRQDKSADRPNRCVYPTRKSAACIAHADSLVVEKVGSRLLGDVLNLCSSAWRVNAPLKSGARRCARSREIRCEHLQCQLLRIAA